MGAYHNTLREEGTREDLLAALEKAWAELDSRSSLCKSLGKCVDKVSSPPTAGDCRLSRLAFFFSFPASMIDVDSCNFSSAKLDADAWKRRVYGN